MTIDEQIRFVSGIGTSQTRMEKLGVRSTVETAQSQDSAAEMANIEDQIYGELAGDDFHEGQENSEYTPIDEYQVQLNIQEDEFIAVCGRTKSMGGAVTNDQLRRKMAPHFTSEELYEKMPLNKRNKGGPSQNKNTMLGALNRNELCILLASKLKEVPAFWRFFGELPPPREEPVAPVAPPDEEEESSEYDFESSEEDDDDEEVEFIGVPEKNDIYDIVDDCRFLDGWQVGGRYGSTILGQGSTAPVYLGARMHKGKDGPAYRVENTEYAIKVYPILTEAKRERFENEVAILSALRSNPYVPKVHGVWTCNGKGYIVMDRLSNICKLTPADVRRAVRSIHVAGYTHNDLHKENFMCDKNGNIKLIDFEDAEQSTDTSRDDESVKKWIEDYKYDHPDEE